MNKIDANVYVHKINCSMCPQHCLGILSKHSRRAIGRRAGKRTENEVLIRLDNKSWRTKTLSRMPKRMPSTKVLDFSKTFRIGRKNVTVNGFKWKPYIHFNDSFKDKLITLTKDEFLSLMRKMKNITSAISMCEKKRNKMKSRASVNCTTVGNNPLPTLLAEKILMLTLGEMEDTD